MNRIKNNTRKYRPRLSLASVGASKAAFCLLGLLLCLVCLAPTARAAGKTVRITGIYVNVRSDASTSAQIVGKVYQGESYPWLAEAQDESGQTWYRIRVSPSVEGWVTGKLAERTDGTAAVTPSDAESPASSQTEKSTVRVTFRADADKTLLYAAPGQTYHVVGTVSRDDTLLCTESRRDTDGDTWYRVRPENAGDSEGGWLPASAGTVTRELPAQTDKSSGKRIAYLTFDDGPSCNTMRILNILDRYHVKATFFVIYQKGMDSQYKAIAKRGHTIALHTFTHEFRSVYADENAYLLDLRQIHDYIQSVTGVDSHIIRFPGGSSNTISNKYCKGLMKKLKTRVGEEGYIYHDWNVDSTDASGNNRPVDVLLQNVKVGIPARGRVVNVLMHDTGTNKNTTVEALPSIIEYIRAQGYEFRALGENSAAIHHGW